MQQTEYEVRADLQENGALEDEIYLQMDKLLALCEAQTALTDGELTLSVGSRSYYALVMEEQARSLRSTLVKLLE